MAGNSAAANVEGFVYVAMNAVYQATITFVSQNLGAGKPSRIRRIMAICLVLVSVVGLVLGLTAYFCGHTLLGIYASDSEGLREQIIAVGKTRMRFLCAPYFLCGLMEVACGGLRGLGKSWLPTTIALLGSCVMRIIWIQTVFRAERTLESVYISYPISWLLTFAAHLTFFVLAFRKIQKLLPPEPKDAPQAA